MLCKKDSCKTNSSFDEIVPDRAGWGDCGTKSRASDHGEIRVSVLTNVGQ